MSQPAGQQRVLLVISAQPAPTMTAEIVAGRQPRRDYEELRAALGADILHPTEASAGRVGRLLRRAAGQSVALAWAAVSRAGRYDAIYSDSERVGLPLALLLALRGRRAGRPRHVMLTHHLTPTKKRIWFRLGVARRIDTLIVHSSAQREVATGLLRLPPSKVLRLPYFADERFWDARAQAMDGGDDPERDGTPEVCAVGLEFRDYTTLAAAARDLPARVRIAAASHWSDHGAFAGATDLPPNVDVRGYDYLALRALYARSRVVVVPLVEVDNQAGITVILEAMAMGKPVIVSGTRGQTDVVRDRRNDGRGRMERAWWPGFVDAPGPAERIGRLPTGFYVRVGDAGELHRALRYLLDHPDVADELGRNGRRVVEVAFPLDAFTARFAAAIRGEPVPADSLPVGR